MGGKDLNRERGEKSEEGKEGRSGKALGGRGERISTGKGCKGFWGGIGRKGSQQGGGNLREEREKISGLGKSLRGEGGKGSHQGKAAKDLREENGEDLRGGKA